MKKTCRLAVMLILLLHYAAIWAQPVPGIADSMPAPVQIFYRTVKQTARLYNGTEYVMYDQHIKGDPYFLPQVQPGSILYDGTLYTNIPMLYETTSGNLVIRQYNNGVLMNLISEKVGQFTLSGHYFVHIVPDSANTILTDGFYDRIYNGSASVYVKRQKILFEDGSTFERSFILKDRYFIYANNNWYPVHSQNEALDIFKDKRKEISKYLRQNGLKYRKAPEATLTAIAAYHDKLTH